MSGLFAFCNPHFLFSLALSFLSAGFGSSLGFSDMGIMYCRQVETYNMMILFDKNYFGLSRRSKAT
jgi:hypothetical protein